MAKDIAKFYFERNNGMDYTVKLLGSYKACYSSRVFHHKFEVTSIFNKKSFIVFKNYKAFLRATYSPPVSGQLLPLKPCHFYLLLL